MAVTFKSDDNPTPPNITILELNYVCFSSGMFRGTYRGISFVSSYECVGARCPSSPALSQFDFSCSDDGMWIRDVLGTSEFSRQTVADATLTTPNRTDCSFCVSPTHPQVPSFVQRLDNTTHCVGIISPSFTVDWNISSANYSLQPVMRPATWGT